MRTEHRTPAERKTLLYLMVFGGSGIVLLAAVLGFVALRANSSPGGNGSSALIKSSSCQETAYPGLRPKHLSDPAAKVKYNSFPPSSGPHYAQWAPWNLYEQPVRQTILVHNLEHGAVILQYGNKVSEADKTKIRNFYNKSPNAMVVAPYPKLGSRIAEAAWNEPGYTASDGSVNNINAGNGYVLMCTKFDEGSLAKFRDKRRGKAGERFPISQLTPGTQ